MINKKVKILIALIITFIALFIINQSSVKANSIKGISMDIYIEPNGDAQVTETWEVKTSEGTECYHPYYNLGNSKITNLVVSDNTKTFETLGSWNTKKSFNDKAYTCGINRIENGVELCWGISKYGKNTYTVKYNISNFVSELTDAQMIYWTLIPYEFSDEIESCKIKIYADKYIEDTVDVWGYGNYGGLCYVSDGAIYMEADGELYSDEYMTILVKFPPEMFNATNHIDQDFNYFYELSIENAKKYEDNSWIIIVVILILVPVGFIFLVIVGIVSYNKGNTMIEFGEAGGKIAKDVPYYRDIPFNGDIIKSYFVANQYRIIKNKTDILGAIILKWIKDGQIQVENRSKDGIFKKEETALILTNAGTFETELETSLYKMMLQASKDGILENKEFEKWCNKGYDKILNWFDKILTEERKILVRENYIKEEKSTSFFSSVKFIAEPSLKEQADNIAGLKKYLLDYTLIKDREAIEVKLFENYLVYAQMLGIAKEVAKEFKDLYPDIIEQSSFNSYDYVMYINTYSNRVVTKANSARAAAESYSSGGGGFSSGGGGGGSFGGGGGGRRFPLK